MIVIGELGLELQERTRESHSVVLLGTSECALAMSHSVTRRSEPDRQSQINAKLALGEFRPTDESEREPVHFSEFAESWLQREIEMPLGRGFKGHVAHGTARAYRLQVDVHLSPYFQSRNIREIGLQEIQGFYDHCLDVGRPKSAKSIDMALNVLRLVISHAIGQGLVESNSVEVWKRRRPRRRSSSNLKVPANKLMSADDLQRVLDTAEAIFPDFYPLILFLADTGVRIGEAAALRWVDVDLQTQTARISRSFSSGVTLGPTKTGKERVVELSSRLTLLLAQIEPNVFPHPEDSLVFSNQRGGYLQATNFRRRVFSRVVAKALGKGRHYSPHSLRHTWTSLHMARGTPLKWIQDQGGWTTAKLLLDTYGHYMPTESHGFADVLSGVPERPYTAPPQSDIRVAGLLAGENAEESESSEDDQSTTDPRPPITQLGDPARTTRRSASRGGAGAARSP
jgi:integrase